MLKFDRSDPFFACPPANPLWEKGQNPGVYSAEDENALWRYNVDADEYTMHPPHKPRGNDWEDECNCIRSELAEIKRSSSDSAGLPEEQNLEDMCSELYSVLCVLGDKYISRLPEEFIEGIAAKRNKSYKPVVFPDKSLEDQSLSKETFAMIAYLKLKYWCDTEEERQKCLEQLEANELRKNTMSNEKPKPEKEREGENNGAALAEKQLGRPDKGSIDMLSVIKATRFAKEKHNGWLRDDGRSYYEHIIDVVGILTDNGIGWEGELVVAALHHTLEEMDATYVELCSQFGEEVAKAVELLTKSKDESFDEYADRVFDSGDCMHNAAVILLADTLANLRDLPHCGNPSEIKRYIAETKRCILPRKRINSELCNCIRSEVAEIEKFFRGIQ